jgi:hypothetical protein
MRGIAYKVGDKVAKADSYGSSATLRVSAVTKIENGKMYLDDAKVTIHYPGRMLIIDKVYERIIGRVAKW